MIRETALTLALFGFGVATVLGPALGLMIAWAWVKEQRATRRTPPTEREDRTPSA
jgi:hypothetical protein